MCGSDTWEAVIKVLWGHAARKDIPTSGPSKRIGYHLPVTCQKHGNKVFIEDPSDWEHLSGGCGESCRCLLPCGHTCMLACHPFDSSRIVCRQQCKKPCTVCGQACSQSCSDPCRCTYCERLTGNRKALIKPLQKTSTVQQSLPSSSFHDHPNALLAAPTVYTASARTVAAPTMATPDTVSEHSGSKPKQWQDYAYGGVKADDVQAWQKKRKEEAAKFQELISNRSSATTPPPPDKLIQISPKKNVSGPSANTALLIDLLDKDVPTLAPLAPLAPSNPCEAGDERMSYKEKFSYVADITNPIDENEDDKDGKEAVEQRAPAPVFNLLD